MAVPVKKTGAFADTHYGPAELASSGAPMYARTSLRTQNLNEFSADSAVPAAGSTTMGSTCRWRWQRVCPRHAHKHVLRQVPRRLLVSHSSGEISHQTLMTSRKQRV